VNPAAAHVVGAGVTVVEATVKKEGEQVDTILIVWAEWFLYILY